MKVKEFLNYIEAMPYSNNELMEMEIQLRYRNSAGDYSTVCSPRKVEVAVKGDSKEKPILIVTAGFTAPDYGETKTLCMH